MALIETDFVPLEPLPLRYGMAGMLGSIIFFQLLNIIVKYTGPPKCVKTEFWKWRNLFISWIHALIVGTWDCLCFYLYPEMWANLIFYHNTFIYLMVAFSTGYFMYDFLDIVLSGRMKSSWEVVIHHIFVAGIFLYNVLTCQCIAYTMLALGAEVNSLFLHSRKLLQLAGLDFHHPVYRVNVFFNLVSFLVGRFGGLFMISYGMFHWRERVSFSYYVCLSSSMLAMTVINSVLFYRLIKNDIVRPWTLESTPATVHANNNVKENGVAYKNGFQKID